MAARDNKTGLAVTAAILLLGGGAIGGWLLWWKPRQDREASRAQVTAWESKWLTARRCILGDHPLATEASDALALAELSTGSMRSNATDCTGAVRVITRPPGAEATDDVERAFAEVEAAIPALAKAYAFRISADPDEIDRRVVELGVAIDALDAAHDRLRATAGMAPIARDAGATPLVRLPDPVALQVVGRPVTTASARAQAGVVAGALYGDVEHAFVLTGPAAAKESTVAIGAIAAVPDGSWMAATLPARAVDPKATDGQLAAVAMPAAPTIEHAAAVQVAPTRLSVAPIGALGSGDERAVLLVPDMSAGIAPPATTPRLSIAVSKDRGKTWAPGAPITGLTADVATSEPDRLAGVVDVIVANEEAEQPTMQWLRFDGAHPLAPPTVLTVPSFDPRGACRRGGVVWGFDETSGVVRIAGAEVMQVEASGDGERRLVDCTADAAMLEQSDVPVRYQRCTRDGCKEAFRGSTYAYGRAAMLDDGTIVYAAGRGQILALWKENVAQPTYFKLPHALTLHGLVVWDGRPYALLYPAAADAQPLYAVPLKV